MWWTVGVIGVVCFVIWLLFVWAKMAQARGLDQDIVLERIASEYLALRQKHETMDQIKDALYRLYSVTEPVEFWQDYFNPLPFGNLMFAGYAKKMPEDALRLGEIAFTILCHRGIYPSPREDQGPRDSACEYDAMTKICSKCMDQMVVLEATGKKVDSSLWEMMRKWSALESEISILNASWEKALRPSPRPEMRDTTEGIAASEGLFGTKWLMPMEQVLQIVPQVDERTSDAFSHFGNYYGRQATFSYLFRSNLLTQISVCLNNSSEKDFNRMQALLSANLGPLPLPAPTNYYPLLSKGEVGGLEIEHWLRDIEPVGLTEMIRFRSTAKPK